MPLPKMDQATPGDVGIVAKDIPSVAGPEGVPSATAVAEARPFDPPQIGVTAFPMTGQVFAGFKLAKIVLSITAATIAILVIFLAVMEFVIGSDIRTAYERVLSPSRIGAEFLMIGELDKLSNDLTVLRKNPAVQWNTDSLQNAQKVIQVIGEVPSIAADQKTKLQLCLQPPSTTDSGRDSKLDACIAILGGIRQAILDAVASTTDVKVAGDSAAKVGEQRQALHTFWIQAAQLMLLNLLLPLLTALFGYIFGTQQPQRTS